MARFKDGRCKNGHEMTEANTIMRAGGVKGRKHRACRTCYNEYRRKDEKRRYHDNFEFREKKKAKTCAYKRRKKLERAVLT